MAQIRRSLVPFVLLGFFLLALMGLGFLLSGRELPSSPADFACFYLGAKALLQGQDAYSLDLVQRMAPIEGYDGWVYRFLYPPHFAFLLFPFVLFSINVGATLWSITSILLLILSIFLLCQGEEGQRPGKWLFLIATLAAALSAPVVWTIILGQNSTFFLFFGALALWSLRSGRYWLAGIALATATAKPQIMLVFVILMLVVCLQKRIWSTLIVFATALAVMSAAATVIRADLLVNWLKTLVERQTQGKVVLSSLVLFKQHLGDTAGVIVFLLWVALVLGVALYLVVRLSKSEGDVLSLIAGIGTAAMLLISPYYEPYDCVVLLLAVLPATKMLLKFKDVKKWGLIVLLWLGQVIFPALLWAVQKDDMIGPLSLVMILSPLTIFVGSLVTLGMRTSPVSSTKAEG